LEENEKKELFKNCIENLQILRAEIVSALENPYILYNGQQKSVIKTNLNTIESLIGEIQ